MRSDQVGLFNAFDTNRNLIYLAATQIYSRGHRGFYDLVGSDF
jgi:hypothetical protein